MRILLTGSTGQVGGALYRPLTSIGTVLATDRRTLNLSEPETIPTALDRLRPDLIVNPAAYTAVDIAEDESDLAFRVNADAPGAMARWAAVHDVPLIHFSTDYLFDGSGDVPWREDSLPAPLSVYGASKLAGEQQICKAHGRHIIVRTSWVYAAQGRNFLRTIARLAQEQTELRIVSDQLGAPTSARIIANAVAQVIRGELTDGAFRVNGGPLNLTASGVTSWHGFAMAIVAGMKQRGAILTVKNVNPVATSDYPTKATRPLNSRLDERRLRALFGIHMPSWQEALDIELNTMFWERKGSAH